ncbi:PilC/PilY family type IV pilus protein [Luteimonas sp. MC1828]|uniref:pilus assembly protein n=1 Tax=Luteimonas sp. MC1828 TaxID=2799787 RepID=UPI001F4878CC|nr:PilC/PilY family type IV pilus protein [Luteimonas sp. MC1828]
MLLALPANATIDIPNDPLTTGARVPPNIMFILDNSGSMALVSMPTLPEDFDVQPSDYSGTPTGASRSGLRDNPHDRSYLNNGIYYNPAVTYNAWMSADGVTRMTGGTTADEVFSNWNLASGSIRDLRGNIESVFYVPKAGVAASTSPSPADYDRYSISSSGSVVKSIVGTPSATPALPAGPFSSRGNGVAATVNISVANGTTNLRVFTTGGSTRVQLDLYRPNGILQCTSKDGNGGESCSVSSPVSGAWQATVRRDGGTDFSGVSIDAVVDVDTPSLPNPARTQAQELTNIATWYSYYRTRLKTAKAGASEAFASLGNELRVGYTPINGRSSHLSATGTNPIIPVNDNNGLFEATNKSNWFTSVRSETVQAGSTPLRTSLKAVGDYYTRADSNGPWGPGALASQLSCRQSFSILTTDGYWNDSNPSGIGDSDGDGNSPTLADVAHHYYKTDLRSNLTNNVPSSTANPASWQHMVTFGISIGLRGNMAVTNPPPAPNSSLWTNPMDREDADRIDDLWHAAVNSKGKFVAAADPAAFTQGLQSALAEIVERTGSFSNVAANSTSLDAGTRVYQANYVSSVWTGELRSQPVSAASGVQAVDCSGPADGAQPGNGWCASKGIPTVGRKVFTSNGHHYRSPVIATTPNQNPLPFPSQATTEQLASLHRPLPGTAWVDGADNAAYIAGNRALELNRGGRLRNRNNLLGDIIGSSPAYAQDTNTIYIGANDGMLHAINAANGNELFAYIPGIINWNQLGNLSRPEYGHRYFVDGPIVVTTHQQTPDENILVGALGKGGKGLFALDVTNPSTFGAGSNVKWELADTPLGNMGLVQGRPIIAKVRGGGAEPQNAVVLGNGVNSTSNRAALIVLDLATGAVIREIAVGPSGGSNGLSAVSGVLGPDGRTLSHAYGGDMLGNVWKFDLTNASPAAWTGTRMFTATAGGVAQPISGGLTTAIHPSTNKRWVFFGTGRYMTQSDVGNTAVQSMYGFIDDGTPIVRTGAGANLTQRQVQVTSGTAGGYPVRGFEASTPLPLSSKGWFIDLPASGERIVQDAQVVSTFLITASVIPSGNACDTGGSGYINALDAFTGTSASGSYFDLDGDGLTSDEVVGGRPVGSVNVGGGMPTLPNLLRGRFVVGGSGGSEVRGTMTLTPRWDRASWREVRGD